MLSPLGHNSIQVHRLFLHLAAEFEITHMRTWACAYLHMVRTMKARQIRMFPVVFDFLRYCTLEQEINTPSGNIDYPFTNFTAQWMRLEKWIRSEHEDLMRPPHVLCVVSKNNVAQHTCAVFVFAESCCRNR